MDPFHFAFPVNDIAATRAFYHGVLGCPEGRSSETWVDFNFFGHQIVAHLSPKAHEHASSHVDEHNVPVPHFGVVLQMHSWLELVKKLEAANVKFIIEPCTRFKGEIGEQAIMFFFDPSGNALEFKAFADISQLFEPDFKLPHAAASL